jgi:hypothetical protein
VRIALVMGGDAVGLRIKLARSGRRRGSGATRRGRCDCRQHRECAPRQGWARGHLHYRGTFNGPDVTAALFVNTDPEPPNLVPASILCDRFGECGNYLICDRSLPLPVQRRLPVLRVHRSSYG